MDHRAATDSGTGNDSERSPHPRQPRQWPREGETVGVVGQPDFPLKRGLQIATQRPTVEPGGIGVADASVLGDSGRECRFPLPRWPSSASASLDQSRNGAYRGLVIVARSISAAPREIFPGGRAATSILVPPNRYPGAAAGGNQRGIRRGSPPFTLPWVVVKVRSRLQPASGGGEQIALRIRAYRVV